MMPKPDFLSSQVADLFWTEGFGTTKPVTPKDPPQKVLCKGHLLAILLKSIQGLGEWGFWVNCQLASHISFEVVKQVNTTKSHQKFPSRNRRSMFQSPIVSRPIDGLANATIGSILGRFLLSQVKLQQKCLISKWSVYVLASKIHFPTNKNIQKTAAAQAAVSVKFTSVSPAAWTTAFRDTDRYSTS